jgi:xanthine dehydrogenase YagR molybdenum-binding subunit
MNELIGQPVDRVDGRLKVTGKAPYSAEFPLKNLAYGVTVQSTIASGRIRSIDSHTAEALPGVIAVITFKNSMSLHTLAGGSDPGQGKFGEKDLLPLQSDRIFYDGQHIAIVVAETFQIAEHGASLLKVEYDEEKPVYELEQSLADAFQPATALGGGQAQAHRGEADKALADAEVKMEETYTTPVYHHNAMEPHATTAEWKGRKLTIYDSTQSVVGSKNAIAQILGVPPEDIRLFSYFIGGGFGSKGFTWPHSVMAPMAAKQVGRPVKIVLTRQQMFTSNGHRARTIQKISLGADKAGKLVAMKHLTVSETSFVDEFVEQAGVASKMIYDVPNLDATHSIVRVNKGTPCPTRAPGEAPGTYAMEAAMDELAYQLHMDPIALRLVNYADKHPHTGQPWSEKNLRVCYERGAQAIGWAQRNPAPRSMKEGSLLVGYGMATATYPANRSPSSAKIQLFADGHAVIYCATQDIGTGTYTVLTQITAQGLGLPMASVQCKLGDSSLPKGPNSGGSQVSASAGGAVWAAALTLKSKAIQLAIADKKSPLFGQTEERIAADGGRIFAVGSPAKGESYGQLLARKGMPMLETEITTNVSTREGAPPPQAAGDPKQGGGKGSGEGGSGGGGKGGSQQQDQQSAAVRNDEGVDHKKYAFHSFGAQFAKVLVDPTLGTVRVAKIVGVMDIGKVLNLKTATNQIMGGMIFGIGMALMEGTIYDPTNGRVVTRDLADYLVPVNADMPEFDIQFIDIPDPYISPVGARGIGEIGITGITAAIANAIYHATGKRVRDLPITPDKLLS